MKTHLVVVGVIMLIISVPMMIIGVALFSKFAGDKFAGDFFQIWSDVTIGAMMAVIGVFIFIGGLRLVSNRD